VSARVDHTLERRLRERAGMAVLVGEGGFTSEDAAVFARGHTAGETWCARNPEAAASLEISSYLDVVTMVTIALGSSDEEFDYACGFVNGVWQWLSCSAPYRQFVRELTA
jgi:hypothetical protein